MTQAKRTTHQMYPLVERYLQGHKPQKAFCAERDLSTSVLGYWLAKYRRETAERPSAFVEITPASAPAEEALLEIVYPHGVRLRLFSPVEPAYLAQWPRSCHEGQSRPSISHLALTEFRLMP